MAVRFPFRRARRALRVAVRPEPVLWSHATALEIVTVFAQDAEAGKLTPAEAREMIARVWQRTAPRVVNEAD